jgi:hypothetical protein
MRVFENNDKGSWGNRLNFVDKNNVLLGYDYSRSCCEDFYYEILTEEPTKVLGHGLDLLDTNAIEAENLVFDITFNKGIDGEDEYASIFKVVGGAQDFYIMLVNCHNGYYGHGFSLTDSSWNMIFDGSL